MKGSGEVGLCIYIYKKFLVVVNAMYILPSLLLNLLIEKNQEAIITAERKEEMGGPFD